jgi:hypothetical protein
VGIFFFLHITRSETVLGSIHPSNEWGKAAVWWSKLTPTCPLYHRITLLRPCGDYAYIFTYPSVYSCITSNRIFIYCSWSVFELTVTWNERSYAVLKMEWIFLKNVTTEGKRTGAHWSWLWCTEVCRRESVRLPNPKREIGVNRSCGIDQ